MGNLFISQTKNNTNLIANSALYYRKRGKWRSNYLYLARLATNFGPMAVVDDADIYVRMKLIVGGQTGFFIILLYYCILYIVYCILYFVFCIRGVQMAYIEALAHFISTTEYTEYKRLGTVYSDPITVITLLTLYILRSSRCNMTALLIEPR